jgi:hypothetical protein
VVAIAVATSTIAIKASFALARAPGDDLKKKKKKKKRHHLLVELLQMQLSTRRLSRTRAQVVCFVMCNVWHYVPRARDT